MSRAESQASLEQGGGAGDSGFHGHIGEPAIYNTALSAARIAAHYAGRNLA